MKARPMAIVILFIVSAALYSFQAAAPQENPKAKSAKVVTLPQDAQHVMKKFQEALKESQWEKAVSYCSERVIIKAKEYPSIETFLQSVVPVELLVQMKSFPIRRFQSHGEKEATSFGCYVRLKEPIVEPNAEPTISWAWSLNKTDVGWLIDFETIPLEQWIAEETVREKRASEENAGQRKVLEQKLKDVEIRLSPVSDTFILGQPMLFRLELINDAKVELGYINMNNAMIITDEHGERIRCTADEFQIFGTSHSIKPGERDVLFDNFDITTQYAITSPGTYKVQFSGKGLQVIEKIEHHDVWHYQKLTMTDMRIPSNVVEIDVTPSALE